MSLSRTQVIQSLVNELKAWPNSIACWEGGSTATQRADQFSDLDLVLCVEENKIEEAFLKIEKLLSTLSKITHKWRVPEPTWHGLSQSFYKIDGTPKFFFLDISVMTEKAKQRFLEKERHGEPLIYFDKKNFIQSESADTEDFKQKRRERLQTIEASFPFFKEIVLKEIQRSKPLDALAFYRNLTAQLFELYGMKYRPFRYDFGFRYAHVDFPAEIQSVLEKLCFVADLNEIEKNLPDLESRMHDLINELKSSI